MLNSTNDDIAGGLPEGLCRSPGGRFIDLRKPNQLLTEEGISDRSTVDGEAEQEADSTPLPVALRW